MAGDFSVQNVLEADTLGTTDDSDSNTRDKESENAFEKDSDNPVTMGLLTPPTAIQLFDRYVAISYTQQRFPAKLHLLLAF